MSMRNREGFALMTVILVTATISLLVAAIFSATTSDLASARATSDGATGFYSAEAGLNIRGERIRGVFQGYARPSGLSPDPAQGCVAGNLGSGHFQCTNFAFNGRTVSTYVVEDPRNNDPNDAERMITIPPGERFAGLNAIQYRYSVVAEATPVADNRPEAMLEMVFRTRLVPLFQFAAFYNKDLEINPGPNMTLAGPVHVNGDLYMSPGATLDVNGQITVSRSESGLTGGGLWRGRKDSNVCGAGTVRVDDANGATNPNPSIPCGASPYPRLVPQAQLGAWNGRIETGMDALTVPGAEEFTPGGMYWRQADLIVALDLRAGLAAARIIVPNRDTSGGITENIGLTVMLNDPATCPAVAPRSYSVMANHAPTLGLPPLPVVSRAVEWSNSFRDRRESPNAANRQARRLMLEVDVRALLNCMHNNSPNIWGDSPSTEDRLDDSSGGGIVWYFTVLGPFAADPSSGYGVRLRNGWRLTSTIGGAPDIRGLTVVTDQAFFVEGNYNIDDMVLNTWRPAAVLADAINILSENYRNQQANHTNVGMTAATPTIVQAAFLGGTHTTGGAEGSAAQNCGGNPCYNGGLENYPIFHENWTNQELRYRGSFVSLKRPEHSNGAWTGTGIYYNPPIRTWGYETRFNNVTNLPPLSPRFVYLLQERFVREFTR